LPIRIRKREWGASGIVGSGFTGLLSVGGRGGNRTTGKTEKNRRSASWLKKENGRRSIKRDRAALRGKKRGGKQSRTVGKRKAIFNCRKGGWENCIKKKRGKFVRGKARWIRAAAGEASDLESAAGKGHDGLEDEKKKKGGKKSMRRKRGERASTY